MNRTQPQGFRVLIVDDSQITRTVIKRLLQERRPTWLIEEAEDGQAALTLNQSSSSYEMITIDMHMPVLDGFSLVERLKELGTKARLVFVTANVQQAVRTRAEQLGLTFILKPVTGPKMDELLKRLGI